MFKGFLFLCLFCSLFAQDNSPPEENPIAEKIEAAEAEGFWKFHHWASVGYRRDRQRFEEADTKTAYTDRNTLQLLLGSHLEWHEIVLRLRGSYGWLVNGHFDFSAPGSRFGEPLFFGQYDLGSGYAADAIGTLGFRIRFIHCPNFGLFLLSSGGYKYSHLMNTPRGEHRFVIPNPPALLAAGTSGFALARFPTPNQQDWFGPMVEGRLEFRFWENCEWTVFYQYHWLTVRSKSKEEVDLYLFNPPTTATAIDLFRSSSIYKSSNVKKQVGGTDLIYWAASGWNFGVHFEGSSAWTHKAQYQSKRTREQYILAPTGVTTTFVNTSASIHWICYEVSTSLGYQF